MVSYIGENYAWANYETVDGDIVYSYDLEPWIGKADHVVSSGYADAGVSYILENGYPNSTLYGNDAVDRYITQAAIFLYANAEDIDEDYIHGDDPYGLMEGYIAPLVEEASRAAETDTASRAVILKSSTQDNVESLVMLCRGGSDESTA